MSVYIKIKEAHLAPETTSLRPVLFISSKDNTLKAEAVSGGNVITWNSSFISSSKEKKIVFEIKEEKNESKSYGRAELYFSSLRSKPEQEFAETLSLDNGGKLCVDVYFTERQNFIGEIAFYSYEGQAAKSFEETTAIQETTKAESRRLFETPVKVTAPPPKTSLFFCCGDEVDDKLFTVEQDLSHPAPFSKQLPNKQPSEAVEFYKGPCKSTNLFSCCDAGPQQQKFNVIEDYYRDK